MTQSDTCAETNAKCISEIVKVVNDPHGISSRLKTLLEQKKKGCFVLCNAATEASEHDGISAAGQSPAARRLTPALDSEALVLGKTVSADHLPVSPKGIVSPVVISRACLNLLGMETEIIDCGSFVEPAVPNLMRIADQPARCPSSGDALPYSHVQELFTAGMQLGKEWSTRDADYLVIAECVPGGTTTAMAVLNALGHEVDGLLSSSLPTSNHSQRWELVQRGLANTKSSIEDMKTNALLAMAAFGDPMQAFVTGIVSSAAWRIPIILAGGSQMLAVWALLQNLNKNGLGQYINISIKLENICIMSTGWVAFDQSAAVDTLARNLQAPLLAAVPEFQHSRHPGLQAYEEGNVKEGVGAGATMCIANMSGHAKTTIMNAIDDMYDQFVK